MKKILFVSSSNLNSNNYAGDSLRAANIINYLRKNNIVDTISFSNKFNSLSITNLNKKNKNFFFKKNNFFLQLYYSIKFLIKLQPMQLGFFYNKKIEQFVEKYYKKYDTIIFHLIRSSQYLPKGFKGRKILEMTDLMSENYNQTIKQLHVYNPITLLYFIEGILVKKYEQYCRNIFDKIVLVSKKDIKKKKHEKKIIIISNGVFVNKKIYKFKEKNYKILFIGNINYLPNKNACIHFSKKILPRLKEVYPEIKFYIIGKISIFNKLFFLLNNSVKILGQINKIDDNIKNSICGISNLSIATGIQNKILTYLSFGLPSIISSKSAKGLINLKNNYHIKIFKNDKGFFNKIIALKKNRILANKLSKNSYKAIKHLNWNNLLKKYNKII